MVTVYARLAGMLAAIMVILMGVIYARPYDDGGVGAVLLPPDCAAPCLLGIRPGETTRREALALLTSNSWSEILSDERTAVIWSWNSAAPLVLLTSSEEYASVDSEEIVSRIRLTFARYGDVIMTLGQPNNAALYLNAEAQGGQLLPRLELTGLYGDEQLRLRSVERCPRTLGEFWNAPIIIETPVEAVRLLERDAPLRTPIHQLAICR